jgi:hypothetical protein
VATGRLDDAASALPPNLGRAVKVLPWRLWGRGDDDNDNDDDDVGGGGGGGDDGGSYVVLDGDLVFSCFKDFHEFASQPAAAGGRSGHRGGGPCQLVRCSVWRRHRHERLATRLYLSLLDHVVAHVLARDLPGQEGSSRQSRQDQVCGIIMQYGYMRRHRLNT